MGEPNQLAELLQAYGALVELTKFIYDNSLRLGYTEKQAFEMAKIPIQETFNSRNNEVQED